MKTIKEYIQSKPEKVQTKLKEMHRIIKQNSPDTNEALKWGEPAILHQDGMILVIFAAYTNHMNLVVTPSTLQHFVDQPSDYKTSKGSIQFTYDQPLSADLIKSLVLHRATEYEEQGVKWR